MLVIGHRGASAAFPPNTLAAFGGAVAQGADGVELDVRRTRDGRMAISHDEALPDGTLLLETAFADLPDDVPDLAATLDACAPLALVNIEIKNWPDDSDFDASERLAEQVVELLDQRGERASARYLVSCFHLPTVDRVHQLAAGLPTAWLLGMVEDPARLVDEAAEHGHVAIHPHHLFVDEAFVAKTHAAGLQLNTWTCNDPERIRELAAMGVDACVTDVPDVALQALGR
ncbi:MAG: glycerophosphodiester phosphodiesterase [Acidimicrobiales bacterium]